MANGDVVMENEGILISHHVQDAAILDIGVASDPNEIHIPAHDGIEPDAGMVPDHNITDENRAFRDVNALAELRQFSLVFKQHHSKLTELSMLHQLHGPTSGIDWNEQKSQRTPALGKTSSEHGAKGDCEFSRGSEG
jgi:hypothetical protein